LHTAEKLSFVSAAGGREFSIYGVYGIEDRVFIEVAKGYRQVYPKSQECGFCSLKALY